MFTKVIARKEPWKYHCWESEEEWRRLFNEDKTFLLTLGYEFETKEEKENIINRPVNQWYNSKIDAEIQKTPKEIEGTNMSFDLIIANPPYGNKSSLSKKIINLLQPFAKEMVVLAPIRSSVDVIDYIEDIHYLGNLNKYFEASCPAISINRIVSKKVCKYTDLADARKSEKQLQFEKAVRL